MAGRVQKDIEDLFPLFGGFQSFFINPCPEEIGFDGPASF
jgi:hypothetical protein